jgi:hypothetical protein
MTEKTWRIRPGQPEEKSTRPPRYCKNPSPGFKHYENGVWVGDPAQELPPLTQPQQDRIAGTMLNCEPVPVNPVWIKRNLNSSTDHIEGGIELKSSNKITVDQSAKDTSSAIVKMPADRDQHFHVLDSRSIANATVDLAALMILEPAMDTGAMATLQQSELGGSFLDAGVYQVSVYFGNFVFRVTFVGK